MAETDVGAGVGHGRQHAGEVFGGRLGRMGELAVGLFAQHGDAAGKFVQQPPAQDAAGAVVAVQQHAEAALANPLGVDRVQHGQQVGRDRVVATQAAAEAILRQPGGRAGAIAFQDFAARPGGNDAAIGREEFQAVVGRRIVAGGDLDGPGGLEVSQQHAGGGRGDDAGVDGRSSEGLQAGLDGQREHSARGTAVAADQNIARRQRGRKRRGIADRHLRRERLADDSTKSGNADDRFGHGSPDVFEQNEA